MGSALKNGSETIVRTGKDATSSRTRGDKAVDPDPKLDAQAKPVRIFDNQVEYASRENAESLGLIILTSYKLRGLSSAAG